MKRFFTVALIALLSCTVVYAQLGTQPHSDPAGTNKVDNTDKGGKGGKGGKGKNKVDDGTYKPKVLQFEVEGVPFEMVEVRGGTFTMGASSASESWGDDRPHTQSDCERLLYCQNHCHPRVLASDNGNHTN